MFKRLGNAFRAGWQGFRRNMSLNDPRAWVPWSLVGGGRPSASGVEVNSETALQSAAQFACMMVISQDIGLIPLHLYERTPGGKSKRERARGHPLYRVLRYQPNPNMSAFNFRQAMQRNLDMEGNAFAEIMRNSVGQCVGLYPWEPRNVRCERDKGEYKYQFYTDGNRWVDVPARRVFHLRKNTKDGFVGESAPNTVREPIGMALAAQRQGARQFANNSRPGGILKYSRWLKDAESKKLRKSFHQVYGGEGVGGTAVLEGGAEFQPVTPNNDASQLLETREFQTEEIARSNRIPPHMISDLRRATFDNIEHQSMDYVRHSMGPNMVLWEQEVYIKLLAEDEQEIYYAEFLAESLLRADTLTRFRVYVLGIQNGIYSPNEVRDLENMNPRDGGDEFMRPKNMEVSGTEKSPANDADEDTRGDSHLTSPKMGEGLSRLETDSSEYRFSLGGGNEDREIDMENFIQRVVHALGTSVFPELDPNGKFKVR